LKGPKHRFVSNRTPLCCLRITEEVNMHKSPLALAAALLVLPIGCADGQRRDRQYRINKAETESNQLRLALDDERAKVTVLQERLAAEKRQHEIDQAEVNLSRERVQQLEQANSDLVTLMQERARSGVQPPSVPASPLPDSVDRQLRRLAERYAGRLWYDRGRGGVSLADDQVFESGSDVVRPAAQALLGELAAIAARLPAEEYEVIIVGHTDDTPISSSAALARHPSNWHLSVHRAIAVMNTLSSAGLPENRMGVMGYGPHRPLGKDKTRNRRIELFFARRGEIKPLPPIRPTPGQ
jgi:chemotaxis protein MotB